MLNVDDDTNTAHDQAIRVVRVFERAARRVEEIRSRLEYAEGRRYAKLDNALQRAEQKLDRSKHAVASLIHGASYPEGDPHYMPRAIEVDGKIYMNIACDTDEPVIVSLGPDEVYRPQAFLGCSSQSGLVHAGS
jgi:uncharacterized protein (UPF0210 family)